MTTTIQKWGNSLAVRLPKTLLDEKSLVEGSVVRIHTEKKSLVITPLPAPQKKILLSTLLKKITSQNRHTEIAWGAPQGNELW